MGKLFIQTFKGYRGYAARGDVPMPPLDDSARTQHIRRATWLTAQVESGGLYGAICAYDGTGMTAGLHQAVAVYPREVYEADGRTEDDQGPLWAMLRRIMDACPGEVSAVKARMEVAGWVLDAGGVLREAATGRCPSGKAIRAELSGSEDGVLPNTGPRRQRAEAWAEAFRYVFSDRKTFWVQDAHGAAFIAKRGARGKVADGRTINQALYGDRAVTVVSSADLDPAHDLACCMFWSHSVNAPGYALKRLDIALAAAATEPGITHGLPWLLVRRLGNIGFARWDDDIRGGRYQRTRAAAMESGLWPAELFGPTGVMPSDLPG